MQTLSKLNIRLSNCVVFLLAMHMLCNTPNKYLQTFIEPKNASHNDSLACVFMKVFALMNKYFDLRGRKRIYFCNKVWLSFLRQT